MIRLLLDQGLPRSAASILVESGWDALHVGDVGLSRATDEEIIEYARSEKRICVTLDADFHAILALSDEVAPSVIRIRIEGLKGKELAALLQTIWPRIAEHLDIGSLVVITERTVRIRRLPIHPS